MSDLPKHLANDQVVTNGSMGANVTSSAVNTNEAGLAGVQAIWSAGTTPVGTLFLQVSSDGGTTYTNYDSGQAVSGSSGSVHWNIIVGHSYLRIFYSRTSGTATLNAFINSKR